MAEAARRIPPLEGRSFEGQGIALLPAPPASRLSLRAPESSRPALSAALWLGPDEWLVTDETGADLPSVCATVTALHSDVDISHRNVGILVSGPRAEDVLNAGCPQDLSLARFPVGAASRTVLGKAEIV